MTTIVTTSRDNCNVDYAMKLAEKFSWRYIPRKLCDLQKVSLQNKCLVVEKNQLVLHFQGTELFFHPGLSVLRILNIEVGNKDRFIEACGLKQGSSLLDCTMGLGCDAITASYVTGAEGSTVALEAAPEIALIAETGMKNFSDESDQIISAMRRIEIINVNSRQYLINSPGDQFDCIYFDPMFRRPKLASSGLNMLRPFAYHAEIEMQDIALALDKTKKYVVVKETSLELLKTLHPKEILGGKNAKIFYARWEK